jgi:cell division protein FtsZ
MNIEVLEGDDQLSEPGKTVIKVIGAGGGGSNAVNRMIAGGVRDVTFIAVNTDMQALGRCKAELNLPIGRNRTKGLGAGGDPDVGEQAANEDRDMIANAIRGADMVFITAGMGGGTGTGSVPVIAQIAKENGALTVGVVTRPFDFEGKRKKDFADEGIAKLRDAVDALIIIPNQNLLGVVEKRTSIKESFCLADNALLQSVKGISDMITIPGEINIDFADVKTTLEGQGDALMGIGWGSGDHRAEAAAIEALNNPLLKDVSIAGAKHILVNVVGNEDISMMEYQEVMDFITANADSDAHVIIGLTFDETMGDRLQVTVVATGFPSKMSGRSGNGSARPRGDVIPRDSWDSLLGAGMSSQGIQPSDRDIPAILRFPPQSPPVEGRKMQSAKH